MAAPRRDVRQLARRDPILRTLKRIQRLAAEHRWHDVLKQCQRLGTWQRAAHHFRVLAYMELGKLDAVIEAGAAILAEEPDNPAIPALVAEAHRRQGDPVRACAILRPAIREAPTLVAVTTFANALRDAGDLVAAEHMYQRAIAMAPHDSMPRYNLGIFELLRGNYRHGWDLYEERWGLADLVRKDGRGFGAPTWVGQSLAGQRLLIRGEQGFGDALMMARCRRAIEAWEPAAVLWEIWTALVPLWRRWFPGDTIVPAATPLPPYDLHVCTMALGARVGPFGAVPPPGTEDHAPRAWPPRRIGICWASSPNFPFKSLPFALAQQLVDRHPDREWVNLQVGRDQVLERVATPALPDFAATADVIGDLDLVITVDTAVCHLAGCLGCPTWTLLPFAADWRWLLDRDDSPWYPSMRLFRQPSAAAWGPVLDAVHQELLGA